MPKDIMHLWKVIQQAKIYKYVHGTGRLQVCNQNIQWEKEDT